MKRALVMFTVCLSVGMLWFFTCRTTQTRTLVGLTFVELKTDAEWPNTVRVFGAMASESKTDRVILFVLAEPKMFGAAFDVVTENGTAHVSPTEHMIGGSATVYEVYIPGAFRLCNRDTCREVGLRNSVTATKFSGFLK